MRTVMGLIDRAAMSDTPVLLIGESREQPVTTASPAGGQRLADVEREHIDRTLRSVSGNKTAAARVLGLDRKTLYRKLTQHRDALLGRLSRQR